MSSQSGGRKGARLRIPVTRADEFDVISSWRKVFCWTQRAGATSGVKRGIRRRERRAGKAEVREFRGSH